MTSIPKRLLVVVPALIVGLVLGVGPSVGSAQPNDNGPQAGKGPDPGFGRDDIGGVVKGARGQPEAGVWVIAETDDLSTRFAKIVVTDDHGRYVIPDLPDATYQVWVRGYGLVDSKKKQAKPGQRRNLQAEEAPDPVTAAQYYPASWWLSLLDVPDEDEFPTMGFESQAQLVRAAKSMARFQIGNKGTREIPQVVKDLGFATTVEEINYLRNAGQMTEVSINANLVGVFADWYDRIAAGETPPAPPRPQGVERNVVISQWDAGPSQAPFVHDVASSDKRNPTLNADGKVYGVDFHNDFLTVSDPVGNTSELIKIPTQIDRELIPTVTRQSGWANPSPTWGDEIIIRDHANPNHLIQDDQGRVWMSARVNVNETPDFCREGSDNIFAQHFPRSNSTRHVAMYDPSTEEWELIQTCFRTHHVQMAVDGTNRLFANPIGQGALFGWIDIDILEETGDHEAAQGWCGLFFDVDGDGTPEPDAHLGSSNPRDSTPYSVIQSPTDGSLWGAVETIGQNHLVRLDLGSNPPETCVAERFNVPFNPFPSTDPDSRSGFEPRGIDVNSDGVVWTGLAGSGHLASFDRSKCQGPLTGSEAMTGDHCPEGWTLYETPGAKIGDTPFTADWHYYSFIDQHNGFGLGADTPFTNGTNSDSILVLNPDTEEWLTMRVPYPLGFYSRGMDVRIDDPDAGWKGRGLWAVNGSRAVWHSGERGPGDPTQLAKFQLRPDPLAS